MIKRVAITLMLVFASLLTAFGQQSEDEFAMLSAYRDFFEQATDFSLSFARYRTRGYDNNLRTLTWNGIPIEDWERRSVAWSVLGNLSSIGTEDSGGNISTRSALEQSAGRLAASASNRTYRYSTSASYTLKPNDQFGATINTSRKWGESLNIDGVSADSYSFLASGAYRSANKKHTVELSLLFAPTQRSTQRASTAEAYDLTGNNLYNPAWGTQGDTKRSVRQNYTSQPIAILNHTATLNDNLRLSTSLAARIGSEYHTGLSWQNSPNPYPDYYRYMPSFQADQDAREMVLRAWLDDPATSQIDFQTIYNINGHNSPQAKYIIEQRWRDVRQFFVTSNIQRGALGAGLELSYAENHNYKKVGDLMGAEYWLDIDAFVENDDDLKDQVQNNLRNPNLHAQQGDVFGYDYTMTMKRAKIWTEVAKEWGEFGAKVKGEITAINYYRTGHFEKENFDGNRSYGKSPEINNYDYNLTAEGWYRQGGRFRGSIVLGYKALSPAPSQLFISPEYRNATVPTSTSEKIASIELNAEYRTPDFRIKGALYLTSITDKTQLLNFYDDNVYQYTHYWLEGISQKYVGLELSTEFVIAQNIKGKLAVAMSDNRYTSNPTARQWKESTGEQLRTDETVYYENLHTSGSPQNVAVASLEYTPKQYVITLSANYFDNNYISISPLRRTERSTSGINKIGQEKLNAGITLDLFGGRNFYLPNNRMVGVWIGVNNILNNKNIRTGGYESFRTVNTAAADSRYYYALGINGFVSVSYRF